jgi:hypothetical protein
VSVLAVDVSRRLTCSANAFVYTTLPVKLARQVIKQLNKAGASKLVPVKPLTISDYDQLVERGYKQWLDGQASAYEIETDGRQKVFSTSHLTMGYVTKDACPGRGDDIEHKPRTSRPSQNCHS